MQFDHVGLSVGDLEAQAEWYVHALGLTRALPFEVPELSLTGVFVTNGAGTTIELINRSGSLSSPPASGPADAALRIGYGHICLRVADLEATYDRLLRTGAVSRLSPQDSPEPGVRFAWVADPEGNLIELHNRSQEVRP
jgi:catechol 2,3-dioxygenase-like lactoylglutathione lyase family enzyme